MNHLQEFVALLSFGLYGIFVFVANSIGFEGIVSGLVNAGGAFILVAYLIYYWDKKDKQFIEERLRWEKRAEQFTKVIMDNTEAVKRLSENIKCNGTTTPKKS